MNRLKGADNDASALAQTLRETLKIPADHIHLLTSSGANKPTKDNIETELEWLASKSKTIDPTKDVVFVAYSGHGMTDQQTREPYLITYNARSGTQRLLFKTSLPQRDFEDALLAIPAKTLILVYDMCRENVINAGKRAGISDKNPLTEAQVKGIALEAVPGAVHPANEPQVIAKFFACSPGGYSYEIPGQGRGYFSFYLEQGLRGYAADPKTGQVNLSGLQSYLAKAVPDAMEKDKPGSKPQVPTSTIIGPLDAGGFVVVTVDVTKIAGVKTASAKMQQALALVPELIQQAAITAKVAAYGVVPPLMEVWQAQIKAGDIIGAKQTFIRAKQVADDGSARNQSFGLLAIAKAQAKIGDIVAAKQTLADAKQIADRAQDAGDKAIALSAIAATQSETGDIDRAKQTAASITVDYPKWQTDAQLAIAEAQAKIGDIVAAKQTLVGAKQIAGRLQDVGDRAIALSAIAEMQSETGDNVTAKQVLVMAKQIAGAIHDAPRHKVDAFCAIAEAQSKTGDIDGAKQTVIAAKQIAGKVEKANDKVDAFCAITEAQSRAGDTAGAKQTVVAAKQIADTVQNNYQKADALFVVAEAQANISDIDGAKQTAASILVDYVKAPVLSTIVEAQIKAGDFTGAKATIDEITNAGAKAKALAQLASAILDAAKQESSAAQPNAQPAKTP